MLDLLHVDVLQSLEVVGHELDDAGVDLGSPVGVVEDDLVELEEENAFLFLSHKKTGAFLVQGGFRGVEVGRDVMGGGDRVSGLLDKLLLSLLGVFGVGLVLAIKLAMKRASWDSFYRLFGAGEKIDGVSEAELFELGQVNFGILGLKLAGLRDGVRGWLELDGLGFHWLRF